MIVHFYLFFLPLCLFVDASSIRGRNNKNELVPLTSSRTDGLEKDNNLKIVSSEPFIIQVQMPKTNDSQSTAEKDKNRKRPGKKRITKLRKKHRARRDLLTSKTKYSREDKSIPEISAKETEQEVKNKTKNTIDRAEILKALSSYSRKRQNKVDDDFKEEDTDNNQKEKPTNYKHRNPLMEAAPLVKMIYPSAPKLDRHSHKYTYKDMMADRKRLEQKINYIKNMLSTNDSTEDDAVRIRRRSESDKTANKIAKMFLTLSAVNGLHEKRKSKCRRGSDDDDDDEGRVQDVWEKERKSSPYRKASSSNEERYKVKKWIEFMKNKRSSGKTCPCMANVHGDDSDDAFPLEQKLPKDYFLMERSRSSEESSETYRDPYYRSRDKPNRDYYTRRRNAKGQEDQDNKAKTKNGKKKIELPLTDLELYRSRAKQILQNAEEILDKIKEEEEKRLSAPNILKNRLKELTSRIQSDPRNNENDLIRKIQKNLGWSPLAKSKEGSDANTFIDNVKSYILDPYEKAKALTDESTKMLSSYLLRNLGKIQDSSEEQETRQSEDEIPTESDNLQVYFGQVPAKEEEKPLPDSLAKENSQADPLAKTKQELENWEDTITSILQGAEEPVKKDPELEKRQEELLKKRMEDIMKEQQKKLKDYENSPQSDDNSRETNNVQDQNQQANSAGKSTKPEEDEKAEEDEFAQSVKGDENENKRDSPIHPTGSQTTGNKYDEIGKIPLEKAEEGLDLIEKQEDPNIFQKAKDAVADPEKQEELGEEILDEIIKTIEGKENDSDVVAMEHEIRDPDLEETVGEELTEPKLQVDETEQEMPLQSIPNEERENSEKDEAEEARLEDEQEALNLDETPLRSTLNEEETEEEMESDEESQKPRMEEENEEVESPKMGETLSEMEKVSDKPTEQDEVGDVFAELSRPDSDSLKLKNDAETDENQREAVGEASEDLTNGETLLEELKELESELIKEEEELENKLAEDSADSPQSGEKSLKDPTADNRNELQDPSKVEAVQDGAETQPKDLVLGEDSQESLEGTENEFREQETADDEQLENPKSNEEEEMDEPKVELERQDEPVDDENEERRVENEKADSDDVENNEDEVTVSESKSALDNQKEENDGDETLKATLEDQNNLEENPDENVKAVLEDQDEDSSENDEDAPLQAEQEQRNDSSEEDEETLLKEPQEDKEEDTIIGVENPAEETADENDRELLQKESSQLDDNLTEETPVKEATNQKDSENVREIFEKEANSEEDQTKQDEGEDELQQARNPIETPLQENVGDENDDSAVQEVNSFEEVRNSAETQYSSDENSEKPLEKNKSEENADEKPVLKSENPADETEGGETDDISEEVAMNKQNEQNPEGGETLLKLTDDLEENLNDSGIEGNARAENEGEEMPLQSAVEEVNQEAEGETSDETPPKAETPDENSDDKSGEALREAFEDLAERLEELDEEENSLKQANPDANDEKSNEDEGNESVKAALDDESFEELDDDETVKEAEFKADSERQENAETPLRATLDDEGSSQTMDEGTNSKEADPSESTQNLEDAVGDALDAETGRENEEQGSQKEDETPLRIPLNNQGNLEEDGVKAANSKENQENDDQLRSTSLENELDAQAEETLPVKTMEETDDPEPVRAEQTESREETEDETPLQSINEENSKENSFETLREENPLAENLILEEGEESPLREENESREGQEQSSLSELLQQPEKSSKQAKLKVPKSIGEIMKDLEGKEKDDITSIQNLNPDKIDDIIDKIDEAEQQNLLESSEVDCRKECACADEIDTRSRNIGRYEIVKDFLHWMKDLQLNRVLSDD